MPPADPARVAALAETLSLPPALCRILVARGLDTPEAARTFLRPELSGLHPPGAVPDMEVAVERVLRAMERGETVLVHGDYDVDGMAGTALLTLWLRRLGARVRSFLPHRERDGYDLGPAGLEAARRARAGLLITVDSGTRAVAAVEAARREGVDVIVTDHHTPGVELPPALAVLNPNRADSSYPFPDLCGAGVAFKLCQALAEAKGMDLEETLGLLDLVGLGTIADLVPLHGENRILARFGLRAMAQTRNAGLAALMEVSRLEASRLTSGKVGFVLAPRLNAIGRLGEPEMALRLLLTADPGEARRLARQADELNRQRQEIDRTTLEEALGRLAGEFDPASDFGIVLGSDEWHPGVIGIVASRLAERIHRPVVLVAWKGERGRGSARTIPGFHLLEGVSACAEHLERFGGHRQAAGMELKRDRFEAFRRAFNLYAREVLEGRELRPSLEPVAEVRLDELTWDLHRYLQYLGPHGVGNPRPLLLARGVDLSRPGRVVGSGHLRLELRQNGRVLGAIGFDLAHRVRPESLGRGPVDVVFRLDENEYRGERSLQARLADVRPARSVP